MKTTTETVETLYRRKMSTIDTLPAGWTWEGDSIIKRPGSPIASIDWRIGHVRVLSTVAVVRRGKSVESAFRRRVIDTAVQLLLGYAP